jgi:hypothetical protein
MFAPFFFNLLIILLKQRKNQKFGLKESFFHFPLCVPVKNSLLLHKLYKLYKVDSMPVALLKAVEEIKMEAGKLSQTEAFMVRHLTIANTYLKNNLIRSLDLS